MPYVNFPPALRDLFQNLDSRINKLETANRFTVPIVATDPTNYRNGDMWYNSTSSTLKFVNSAGTIKSITLV
jgi:hypothetical protein